MHASPGVVVEQRGRHLAAPGVLHAHEENLGHVLGDRSLDLSERPQPLAGGRLNVRTAGSEPADQVNPAVVEAMAEVGVDLSREFPKPLTDEFVCAADAVITMGCGDACPIYPGKRYLDWELTDPAGLPVEQVRPIRDELQAKVTSLLQELVPAGA